MRTILNHSSHCRGSRVGYKMHATVEEAAVLVARATLHACHYSFDPAGGTPATTESAYAPTFAGSARTESTAAADANTAQERQTTHPRPLRAQERPCHLPECYRLHSGD